MIKAVVAAEVDPVLDMVAHRVEAEGTRVGINVKIMEAEVAAAVMEVAVEVAVVGEDLAEEAPSDHPYCHRRIAGS